VNSGSEEFALNLIALSPFLTAWLCLLVYDFSLKGFDASSDKH